MSMLVIGITGPTGCGKTTLLQCIAARGGYTLDCDALYYELLASNEGIALRRELQAAFPDAFGADGSLQRKALGRLVFGSSARMAQLNEIVFFHIGNAVRARLVREQTAGRQLFAVDAINLFESGLAALCDTTIGVLASRETRIARIMARDSLPQAYAELRVNAQKPDSFYEAHCRIILQNAGTREDFARAADQSITNILKGAFPMTKQEREALLYRPKHGRDRLTKEDEAAMQAYCEDYKAFLDRSKTERECVVSAVELAEKAGFRELKAGMALQAGDKVYCVNRGKSILLAVIGRQSLAEGANIGAAHTDAPRLDFKPNPLYEESELAYFKTHHYGGIRKYQWVTVPLELHGKVVRADGSEVFVKIGADDGDPQFVINDLLPHLGREQGKKPLNEAIPSESLNILIGSWPGPDDDGADRVKLAVMRILHEKYGIVEEDFISAELEAVPAANARDLGFDRSMIGAYGHDDRVCAYAELAAILQLDAPAKTAVCIFADKEEIGSEGVSGMQSEAFEHFMDTLCRAQDVRLIDCLSNSFCMSADVTAAYDPNFADVYEKRNAAFLNYGIGLCKYTGSGGKGGASDASAEVVGRIRKLFNDNGVFWQMAELGKTDAGGGGTVAKYMAKRNIDTLDAGVPVLSMHAPYETVAKLDCYMTYKGMKVFFEQN